MEHKENLDKPAEERFKDMVRKFAVLADIDKPKIERAKDLFRSRFGKEMDMDTANARAFALFNEASDFDNPDFHARYRLMEPLIIYGQVYDAIGFKIYTERVSDRTMYEFEALTIREDGNDDVMNYTFTAVYTGRGELSLGMLDAGTDKYISPDTYTEQIEVFTELESKLEGLANRDRLVLDT